MGQPGFFDLQRRYVGEREERPFDGDFGDGSV